MNERTTPLSKMPESYRLKVEIGKLFRDYFEERLVEKPTLDDREELHFKFARKVIDILSTKGEVIELCPECMAKHVLWLSENGGIPI